MKNKITTVAIALILFFVLFPFVGIALYNSFISPLNQPQIVRDVSGLKEKNARGVIDATEIVENYISNGANINDVLKQLEAWGFKVGKVESNNQSEFKQYEEANYATYVFQNWGVAHSELEIILGVNASKIVKIKAFVRHTSL